MFVILIFVTVLLCDHFKVGAITIFTSPCIPPSLPQIQASWNDLEQRLQTTEEASRNALMNSGDLNVDSLSEQQKASPMTIINYQVLLGCDYLWA